MALTTEEVDDLMHCNCDAEVKALDFDITANRIKAILICTGCGKWYRCPVISTWFRMYGMPKQSDWSKTNRRTANETSIQSPF